MINLCVYGVPPAPVYKGVEEGEGRPSLWRALGESYSHRSRIPPFLVQLGVLPCSRSRKQGRGAAPPLVQFGLLMGGGAPSPGLLPSLSPQAH